MSDNLEEKLNDAYRSLDDSARRIEQRWNLRSRRRSGAQRPWVILGGIAAAAAVLIVLSVHRPEPVGPVAPIAIARKAPQPEPPLPEPVPLPDPPRREKPKTEEPAPMPSVKPSEEPVRSGPEVSGEPTPTPPPNEPKKNDPKMTAIERALATIREVEGTFEFGDKHLRGRQKDFTVATGERIKATTVVKLTLGDDRFILLSPRSVVKFRPAEKHLTLAIDVGDLHAELIGAGTEVRVITRTCDVLPLGTVFTVAAREKNSTVIVEGGQVEVRGAKGMTAVRAGQSVLATDDGSVTPPVTADFRSLAWTKPHRPAESTILFEDFNRLGEWEAKIEKGVAKGILSAGSTLMAVELATDKPIFEAPVRGQIQIVCRSDRPSQMYVQFFVRELEVNFRKEVAIPRSSTWRTLTLNFNEFSSVDESKCSGSAPPGSAVYSFGLYCDEEQNGTLWVDSIRVVDVRP
jgi:hypothetical protein